MWAWLGRSLVVLACLGVFGGRALAAAPAPAPVLAPAIALLEDPSGQLAWESVVHGSQDAQFKPVQSDTEVLNLGYSASAFWLRVTVRNPQGVAVERLLELGYNRLSWVDFHAQDASGAWVAQRTGNLRPFATRAVPDRHFVWPLVVPAQGSQTVYVRVASTSPIFVPLRLWTPEAFYAHARMAYAQHAVYYGMALAMLAFNFLLFVALRDRAYLFYVGFVLSMALSIAVRTGLAKEYLPVDAPWWWESSSFLSNSLACVTFLLFMRQMLQSPQHLPSLDRWILRVLALHALLPLVYVPFYRASSVAMIWVYIATLVFILGSGIYAAWRRLRTAYFFVAAFALLFLTAMLNSLTSLGWLPANIITNNLLQFGSAGEMVLLAFALADRINVLRREKWRAQEQTLAAQRELVRALQDSERALEARVRQRTEELEIANDKLEALSTTDALTGIPNRRKFDEFLEAEWRRAQRKGDAVGVGLIDIDWFKQYNDRYGHPAGDACLRQVAGAIAATLARSHDFAARYGGEEFAFVVAVESDVQAHAIAEKIADAVRALALPHAGSSYGRVTVSIGVAVARPREGGVPEVVLAQADRALYQSKADGRDRVR